LRGWLLPGLRLLRLRLLGLRLLGFGLRFELRLKLRAASHAVVLIKILNIPPRVMVVVVVVVAIIRVVVVAIVTVEVASTGAQRIGNAWCGGRQHGLGRLQRRRRWHLRATPRGRHNANGRAALDGGGAPVDRGLPWIAVQGITAAGPLLRGPRRRKTGMRRWRIWGQIPMPRIGLTICAGGITTICAGGITTICAGGITSIVAIALVGGVRVPVPAAETRGSLVCGTWR
jgi:hypothetical protein